MKHISLQFLKMLEDVRQKQSLIFLSLTYPDILKQSKFTEDEIKIENLALEKLHRQKRLRKHVAIDLLEKQISD